MRKCGGFLMVVSELLNDISHAGLTIAAIEGSLLKVEPKNKITSTLRDNIREHKGALLALLSTPAPCRDCIRFEFVEIMDVDVPGCLYQAPGEYSDGWKRLPNDLERCIIH